MLKRIWDWIKSHTAWLAGGIVALGVAWYLLTHSGGGSGGATTISYPASSGGGGVSGGGGGGSSAPPPAASGPVNLPYSPDFSIIGAISDNALKSLENNLLNLENQANQAFLTGNTSLFTQLQGNIASLQGQIANYTPAATAPPTPTLNGWLTTVGANLLPGQAGNWQELVGWINGTQSTVSSGAAQLWQELINTYGIPVGFQGLVPGITPTPTPLPTPPPPSGSGGGTPPQPLNISLPSLASFQSFINAWQTQGASSGYSNTAFNTLFQSSFPNLSTAAATYLRNQSEAYKTQLGTGPSAQQQLNILTQYYQGQGYTVAA